MQIKFYLLTFILFAQHTVHAAQSELYWTPRYSYGALYTEQSEQISTPGSIGLYSFRYQASPVIGVTATIYSFLNSKGKADKSDEKLDLYKAKYDIVGQYYPHRLRAYLFSRKFQVYGQIGGWLARAKEPDENEDRFFRGEGLVVGVGANYEMLSWVAIDASWKKLIGFTLFTKNENIKPIKDTNHFNIGLNFRLV